MPLPATRLHGQLAVARYAFDDPGVCVALWGLPPPPHVREPSIRPLPADPRADWLVPAVSSFLHNNHAIRDDRWR